LGAWPWAAGHHLISGQRLDGRKSSVFARLEEREPQAGMELIIRRADADVDHDVTVDLNLSEPNTSALQRSRGW
jgi:hypothetical protein